MITLVRQTLKDLKLAIEGTIIMNENLRDALDSMYDARIPSQWLKVRFKTFDQSSAINMCLTDILVIKHFRFLVHRAYR